MIIIVTSKDVRLARAFCARVADPYLHGLTEIVFGAGQLLQSYWMESPTVPLPSDQLSMMSQSRQCCMRWLVVAEDISHVPRQIVLLADRYYRVVDPGGFFLGGYLALLRHDSFSWELLESRLFSWRKAFTKDCFV